MLTEKEIAQENAQINFEKDIRYIESDIITKQVDGKICKYSRTLESVVVRDMEVNQYLAYWVNRYKGKPEYLPKIKECVINKLKTGLTSRAEMLSLVKNSKETKDEKIKLIKLLGGCING